MLPFVDANDAIWRENDAICRDMLRFVTPITTLLQGASSDVSCRKACPLCIVGASMWDVQKRQKPGKSFFAVICGTKLFAKSGATMRVQEKVGRVCDARFKETNPLRLARLTEVGGYGMTTTKSQACSLK